MGGGDSREDRYRAANGADRFRPQGRLKQAVNRSKAPDSGHLSGSGRHLTVFRTISGTGTM
jgi:hypothetical protein